MFLFNHQSLLDGYVMFGLLRRGFTGIAKKEVASFPLLGQILRGLDFAFIDRDNTKSAIETMQPAVDRLRRGLSVVIAPEGTRSLTPRLGRFKKGAFHIAMQAGVPVVPVVMRNTAEVMTRGSLLLRPGTVQVCVLPPIDVDGVDGRRPRPPRRRRAGALPAHPRRLARRRAGLSQGKRGSSVTGFSDLRGTVGQAR